MEKRMNIFISQTEGNSCKAAMALQEWLRDDMKLGVPWISKNIPGGKYWQKVLEEALREARFGILCITTDNRKNPWLIFEGGILDFNGITVFPYVIDLDSHEDLPGPLQRLQCKWADKAGTEDLVHCINDALDNPVSDDKVTRTFKRTWKRLEAKLDAIRDPLPDARALEELINDFAKLSITINEYREGLNFSTIVDRAIRQFKENRYERERFVKNVYRVIERRRESFDTSSSFIIGNIRGFFEKQFTEDDLWKRVEKLEPILFSATPPQTKRELLLKHIKAEELEVYLSFYQTLVNALRGKLRPHSACQPPSDDSSTPTPQ